MTEPILKVPDNKSHSPAKVLGRGTTIGAITGLITAVIVVFILGAYFDIHTNAQYPGSGNWGIILAILCGLPIELVLGSISGAIGGLVGADISDLLIGQPRPLYAVVGGGIAGFAAGILPYILLWVMSRL